MVEFVNLPTWVSLLVIVVLPTLAFCGLSNWVCHRHGKGLHPLRSEAAQDISGYLFSIVGLILGFILVNCWDDMKLAKLDLVNEAQKLVVISRLVEQFPPDDRQSIRAALVEYIDLAVNQEWPTMVKGKPESFTRPAVRKLYDILSRIEAKTATQTEVYASVLSNLDSIVELRNQRLWLAAGTLPEVMWWVVLLGSTLSMTVLTLFPPATPGNYPSLVTLFALMFSLIVYVIVILQYPYSGQLRVEPSLMQEARTLTVEQR